MLDKISFDQLKYFNSTGLVFQGCNYDANYQTSKSVTDSWNRIFKDQIPFIKEGNSVENAFTIDRRDNDKRQDVLIIFKDLRLLNKRAYREDMFYLKSIKRYLEQFTN